MVRSGSRITIPRVRMPRNVHRNWSATSEWMLVGLAGVFVGLDAGVGVLYLRLPPLIQSVAAVFFAVLLSSGVTIFLWNRYPVFSDAGRGYFAFGTENLLYFGIVLIVGAVLHAALGALDTAFPWLTEHRPLVLGCASGLYSAVSVARALNSLSGFLRTSW